MFVRYSGIDSDSTESGDWGACGIGCIIFAAVLLRPEQEDLKSTLRDCCLTASRFPHARSHSIIGVRGTSKSPSGSEKEPNGIPISTVRTGDGLIFYGPRRCWRGYTVRNRKTQCQVILNAFWHSHFRLLFDLARWEL